MVGRLGRAVLKLYNKENAEAMTDLSPVPRQLGALGLFKGMEAVARSLTKMDANVKKVPYTANAPLKTSGSRDTSHTCTVLFKFSAMTVVYQVIMVLVLYILVVTTSALIDHVGSQGLNSN